MPTVVVVLALIFPVLYLSVFLHEVGHAVCSRLVGALPTSFGMGTGQFFLVGRIGGCRIFIGNREALLGLAFSLYPQLLPERWRQVGVMSGGIIANTLAATLSLSLVGVLPAARVFLLTFAAVNASFSLVNLIPYSFSVGPTRLPSDGEQILRILRGRDRTEPGDLLREFRTLSRVWRESGDWRALRAHTVVVAQCWAGLGDAGRAQELLEEARGVDAEPSRPHRAYETLVGGEVALARGDLAGAGSQFTEAEAEFRRLDHPAGLLLTALARGRLLLRLGDTAATLTYFEEVATSPLLRRLPALRPLVDRQIRYCRYERPGGGGVDASLADYESLPPHERSPLQDRQVYTEVAAARERAGRHEQAAEAYGRALEAVAALDQSFSDPDRERFRSTQSGLIRAAQKSLRATGREEEAAKVDSFFLPAAEIERQEKVPPRGDG